MKRHNRLGYLFVAPATFHLLLFALLPILYAFWLSLYKWDILKDDKPYVGFKNYTETFGDLTFWNAMWNSGRYALVGVPVGMAVALLVAVLVSQKLRGISLFRTIYYLPAVASGVAISMLWIYVYLPTNGMINTMLSGWNTLVDTIGVRCLEITTQTDFLNDAKWAMWALVFMSIWTGLGPRMVLFLAGLLGIPQTLYEAAQLDGATPAKSFWKVTIPMLAPTTLFVLVTSTISAFQVFTPVYMMTKGGPSDSTDVVGYHIYNEAWSKFHVGGASAQSFVLLLVILCVSVFQFRLMKRQLEGYSAG